MSGRKRISDERKSLRGTDQPCRISEAGTLPSASSVITAIPKTKLKGTAKRIFAYTACEMMNSGLLEAVSVDLLVAYAREMALYHDMMMEVEREGFTIEVMTKSGLSRIVNPKRKVADSALANARTLASEFGFTPASRMRIAGLVAPKMVQDEFAEFEELL